MPLIEREIVLRAPARAVFRLVSDVSVWPEILGPGFDVAAWGDRGGRPWAAMSVRLSGVRLRGEASIVEARPADLVAVSVSAPIPFDWTWRLQSDDGHTRLRTSIAFEPPAGVPALILRDFARDAGLESGLESILRTIRDLVERPAAAPVEIPDPSPSPEAATLSQSGEPPGSPGPAPVRGFFARALRFWKIPIFRYIVIKKADRSKKFRLTKPIDFQ